MNIDPAVQRVLLDLAAVDAELSRIKHKRRTLPEQQEVDRLQTERQARKDEAVAVQIMIEDLDRDIRKLEGEVDNVRAREERDRKLLAAGSVNAKQLSELQHELGTLERRQAILEDELLEVMERREASGADHEHAGARLSKAEEDLIDASRRRGDALADLDAAQTRCTNDRVTIGAKIDEELLAVYERQLGKQGIGAALLQSRRCGACRIELDRGMIARIAATDPSVVVRCDECGAILVRTKESGL